jgi:hypothetical protein
MEDEKIEQMGSIKPTIFWHIRVRNSIRELHPSYRALSEEEVKMVPDEYWYPDPIHLTKP